MLIFTICLLNLLEEISFLLRFLAFGTEMTQQKLIFLEDKDP